MANAVLFALSCAPYNRNREDVCGFNGKKTRLTMWVGLLCLELSLIVGLYVVPQFQARNAPAGHWEMETPLRSAPGLWVALIVFLALIAVGNIGLIIMIWRGFKDPKTGD